MSNTLLLDKLEDIILRYNEVEALISSPDVMKDMDRYIKLNKEYKDLGKIVQITREYKTILKNKHEFKEVLHTEKDEELVELAKLELADVEVKLPRLEQEIKILLLPEDSEDNKNAILEIRAGTGGDEAGIFAGDLFRMYTKFCDANRWSIEINRATEASAGGYKEIVATISGENVFGILKYESGVHRVQRIPQTETQGRVHTSAATVAVLPEAEEFDIVLNENDIRKDTYCSSGPGGQSVNTTYSAVRLTHIPTGLVVTCQDEKSQLKNLSKAMSELRSRIYALEHQKYLDEIATKRKTMVSTGDRSAKIRTYNYPQGRVTDHRIGFTSYNLTKIVDGEIQPFIDKLKMAENLEKLKESGLN